MRDLIERLAAWALEDEDFTDAAAPEYREGFRDAQRVVLGLIQAWTEPSGSERS